MANLFSQFWHRRKPLSRRLCYLLCTCAAASLAALGDAQQAPPAVQGVAVADPSVPAVISPSAFGTAFYVLNQDMTSLATSTASSYQVTCAAPTGASASASLPKTLANDTQNAYAVGPDSSSTDAITGLLFGSSTCRRTTSTTLTGTSPAQVWIANDVYHGRTFTLTASSTGGPDILTQFSNLSTGNGDAISRTTRTSLDPGAQYTSLLVDSRGQYGLVVATELKTSTSPGNLWVYSPGIGTAFQILDPQGHSLPATNAFILPAVNDGGGDLLVLVNQDNLTASTLSSAPQDTIPFTIIDLGQLQRTFSAVVASGNVVTLPYVSQIRATTVYAAMLGAVYDPVSRLLYAVVGSGSNAASSVLSYDPYRPSSPNETVVADVSNVPYTFGSYPQLAINSASGSLQILTPAPSSLFTVGIVGTGNTAALVNGAPFADSNFQPTSIAANPLFGQTYIASASGQVDVITKPANASLQATVTLNGSDTATAGSSYFLRGLALYSQGDSSLINAPVTVTATVQGGGSYTLATTTLGNLAYPGGSISGVTFTLPGVYTLVATVPATTTHPALTSNTMSVTVGSSTRPYPGVYPTTLTLSVPSTSARTTVTGNLGLGGSTYAPTGRIVVNDASGNEVGRYTFTGAATTYPVQVSLTLPQGQSTLTAVYNGDDQNATSTSLSATITVNGSSTLVTPGLVLTVPASGTAGSTLAGNVTFTSTTTDTPTDNISIYAVPAGTTTPTTLATIPAAQAFTAGGKAFSFTAPSAAQYTVLAYYPGDSKYNSAQSATSQLTTGSPIASTTTSLSGVTSQVAGTPFNLYVRLTNASSSATPTGSITVRNGTTSTVVATVSAAQALASGGYGVPVTLSGNGTYTFTATYPGDANFAASSGSLAVNVKGTLALTNLYVPAGETSGTTITGTVFTSQGGATVPPTGTISVVATNVSTGAKTPLATLDAAATSSTSNLSFTYTAPGPAGLYRVDAAYGGDSNFVASAAPYINFNAIDPTTDPTTIALSVPSTFPPGSAFRVDVVLAPKNATTAVPTGNVVLTATFSGLPASKVGEVTAASAIGKSATTYITLANAGVYTITATYAGDSNFGSSTQTSTVDVELSTTTLVLTGPTGTATGTAATYNVSLNGTAVAPTKGVAITSVTAAGVAGPSTSVAGTSGSAVLTFLNAGTYTVTANFPGDAANRSATATFTTVVTGDATSGFSMTLDDPSAAAAGFVLHHSTSIDVPITLTALNGFTGSAVLNGTLTETDGGSLSSNGFDYNLTDSAGNLVGSQYGIQSVSVVPTATGLHLKIHMQGASAHAALDSPFRRPRGVALAGVLFGAGLLGWRRRRLLSTRLAQVLVVVLVVCAGGALVAGCGSTDATFQLSVAARSSSGVTQTVSLPVHYLE